MVDTTLAIVKPPPIVAIPETMVPIVPVVPMVALAPISINHRWRPTRLHVIRLGLVDHLRLNIDYLRRTVHQPWRTVINRRLAVVNLRWQRHNRPVLQDGWRIRHAQSNSW